MRHVGPYTLLAPIASGSSGAVYFALQTAKAHGEPNPLAAVKLIDPRVADGTITTLIETVSIARGFEHPTAVRILDAGRTPEGAYIAMELIHGQPLSALIQRAARRQEQLPMEIACWIGAELAALLGAAETSGLQHSALAPKKVHVSYGGKIKLAGVGLPELATSPASLPFRAPETIREGRVERASLIYALGVLMYETLTGSRTFRRASEDETRRAILAGDCRPVSEIRGDVPADVATLISRMMSTAEENRPSGFGEVRSVLLRSLAPSRDLILDVIQGHINGTFGEERATFEELRDRAWRKASLDQASTPTDVVANLQISAAATLIDPLPRADVHVADTSWDDSLDDEDTVDIRVDTMEPETVGVPAEPYAILDSAPSSGKGSVAGDLQKGARTPIRSIGPFQVESILHRTRTVTVFGALHPLHGPAQVRALRDEEIEDTRLSPTEWASLLEREGGVARKLDHPHVLRFFDAGIDGLITYVGYEFRRYFPISRELAHRRMLEEDALRFMRELSSALAHLHEKGVVYANLHAQGVSLTNDGRALLADLSFACNIGGPLHPLIGRNVFALSPEYLSGKGYGPSSDLFALGALSYEMLTGTRPFKGLDDYAIIEAVRWKLPRPPVEMDPAISADLSDIIMNLLDKEPSDRFPSATELVDALAHCAG